MFRLGTFGGLWLERDGQRVEGAGPRRLGLLAAVAAAGDRGISRDRLLLLLWPDSTEAKARHALAQTLHALRRDLEADLIRSGPADLLIESENLSCDLSEFLDAVAAGEPERVATLYAGPFLDGFYIPEADEFERWAEGERARLRELALQALEAAAHHAALAGRLQDASGYWRRLCLLAPLNSRMAVAFMTSLAEAGDAAGAIQHGRAHDQACRQELGLHPDPAVGALLTRLIRREWRPSRSSQSTAVGSTDPSTISDAPPAAPAGSHPIAAHAAVRRRPIRWIALLGAMALTALALWRVPALFSSGAGFPDGSLVVLADPVDLSGEPGLGRALGSATVVGLQESRHLVLLSQSRVAAALTRMGRSGDSVLTTSLALEVAARENARAVFALTIAKLSNSYLLTGRLMSPADGGDLAVHQVSVSRLDDVLGGLDRLLRQVLASAGDSRRSRDSLPTLPLVTTRSLEALKLYAEGGESWRRLRFDRAGQLFLRAVAIDSEFALAHVALGAFHYFNNRRPEGDAHYASAQRFRSRLTFREQLTLDSRLATARGDAEGTSRIDLMLAERYPSRQTWYEYGTGLLIAGRCQEAIPALQRALTFDSTSAFTYVNLATCYRALGEYRLALDHYAAAERADSTALVSFNVNHEWGGVFIRLGRHAEAEAAFRQMLGRADRGSQALGHRSLAYLAMLRGRYLEAIGHLTTAVVLTQEPDAFISRLRNEMLLADAHLIRGSRHLANRQLDSALRLAGSGYVEPGMLALLGRVLVHADRITDARRVLTRLEDTMKPANPIDQSSRGLLVAELALARGASGEAFEAIRQDDDPTFAPWRSALMGRALAGRGVLDSALAVTAAFAGGEFFGLEIQTDWVLAPLQVARLAESLGDAATARAALQMLLGRWRDGDADLPVLRDAQLYLARLQLEFRR